MSPKAAGLFRSPFEQAAVGVAQIETATGRFLHFNQRYADIVGYSRRELERLDFQPLCPPERFPAEPGHRSRLLTGETREATSAKRNGLFRPRRGEGFERQEKA